MAKTASHSPQPDTAPAPSRAPQQPTRTNLGVKEIKDGWVQLTQKR